MTQLKYYFFDLNDIKYHSTVNIHISHLDETQLKYLQDRFNIEIDNDDEDYTVDNDNIAYLFEVLYITKDVILTIYDDLIKYFDENGYTKKDTYIKTDLEKVFAMKEMDDLCDDEIDYGNLLNDCNCPNPLRGREWMLQQMK